MTRTKLHELYDGIDLVLDLLNNLKQNDAFEVLKDIRDNLPEDLCYCEEFIAFCPSCSDNYNGDDFYHHVDHFNEEHEDGMNAFDLCWDARD